MYVYKPASHLILYARFTRYPDLSNDTDANQLTLGVFRLFNLVFLLKLVVVPRQIWERCTTSGSMNSKKAQINRGLGLYCSLLEAMGLS